MVSGKRLTIVDDDPLIRRAVARSLGRAHVTAFECGTATQLMQHLAEKATDLVLLDLALPDQHGLSVLSEMRRRYDTPVIIITGQGDEYDEVTGLEIGADDFIRKPFTFEVLLARIRSVLRRYEEPDPADASDSLAGVLNAHGLSIDTSGRMLVSQSGESIALTASEFRILQVLAARPGTVVSRSAIYEAVFNREMSAESRTVDVLISRLRRKLSRLDSGGANLTIQTAHGFGYTLV
jgi:DNA-binding response OmpR family regulator